MCVNTVNCTPGAYRCNGAAVEICNSAGSAWLWSSNCTVACNAGLCTGGCTPGAKRCNGSNVETCDGGGTTWAVSSSCGAPGCDASSSTCILSSLTISTDTTLEGTVVVAGAVEVMANAKLITNTGLTIRAKTITVDQGGTIQANPSGTGTPGDGGAGPYYGGCGGSYGSAGTASYSTYCSPGPVFGSNSDSAVAPGGRGGNSQSGAAGGLGGGVVRLVATDSITVAGRVSADGAAGVISGNYASGSGAGGGILFASDNVNIVGTGIISAAGANGVSTSVSYGFGGGGGSGRVKILYGSSVAVNGSVTGTLTKGLLPPTVITSTSHPDSSLTYNDGFNAVALSWNQPYPTASATTSASTRTRPTRRRRPTAASSRPTSSLDRSVEAVVRRELLPHRHRRQHVEHRPGRVDLPHQHQHRATALTSSTHTAGTWSMNHNPYFTWSMPTANTNYQGVRYVLDHFANTVPTQVTGTFIPTTQQKLQLSNLDDGIWVLHMVTVDKQGYQTKTVAHYQAWIATVTPTTARPTVKLVGSTTAPRRPSPAPRSPSTAACSPRPPPPATGNTT